LSNSNRRRVLRIHFTDSSESVFNDYGDSRVADNARISDRSKLESNARELYLRWAVIQKVGQGHGNLVFIASTALIVGFCCEEAVASQLFIREPVAAQVFELKRDDWVFSVIVTRQHRKCKF